MFKNCIIALAPVVTAVEYCSNNVSILKSIYNTHTLRVTILDKYF